MKSGKARAIGVNNFSTDYLRHWNAYLDSVHGLSLASNQVAFNLLRRHPESNGILALCRKLAVTILLILPLAEGLLTGEYRVGGQQRGGQGATPVPRRKPLRARRIVLQSPGVKTLREMHREALEPLFDLMAEIARSHDATVAQVALNWLIASDPLVVYIPGAKSPSQVKSNAAALSWTMTAAEFARLSPTEADIRRTLHL